uniref:Uncharacterized protein n=1 Tax=Amphimedon queenslandica TaxID=400682 RepID=A0A1X7TRY2_AMPQE
MQKKIVSFFSPGQSSSSKRPRAEDESHISSSSNSESETDDDNATCRSSVSTAAASQAGPASRGKKESQVQYGRGKPEMRIHADQMRIGLNIDTMVVPKKRTGPDQRTRKD